MTSSQHARVNSATRRSFLTLSALAGVASLSACDDILKKTVYTSSAAPEPVVTETSTETIRPSLAQTPGVASDRLVVATGFTLPGGLDPVLNSDPLTAMIGWHVFEGIYNINHSTGLAEDGLGVGEPQPSGNNAYTIQLRDGIVFHDGGDVSSDDLSWSLSRMKTEGPREIRTLLQPIIGLTSSGNSVTVRTSGNVVNLKERLSLIKIAPQLSQIANPGKFDRQQPVGTGPWKVNEMNVAGTLELRSNPDYSGKYPAKYKSLRFNLGRTAAQRATALNQGSELIIDQLSAADLKTLTANGLTGTSTTAFDPVLLGFNCADPAVANPEIRRSLFVSAGADAIVNGALKCDAQASKGFFNAEHPAFSEAPVTGDASLAKGPFRVLASNDEFTARVTAAALAAWKAAGVAVEIEAVPREEVTKRLSAGTFQVVLYNDDPTRFAGDPDTCLRWFYDADASLFKWDTAPERGAVLQAIDAQDYAAAAKAAAGACPVFPLLHRIAHIAFDGALVGGVGKPVSAGLDLLTSKTLPAPSK